MSRLRRLLQKAADSGDSFNSAIRSGSELSSTLSSIIERNNSVLSTNVNTNIDVTAVLDSLSPSTDLAKVAASPRMMRWSGANETATRVTRNGWRLPQCPPRAGHVMLASASGEKIVTIGGRSGDSLDSGIWEYDTRCRCWWERDIVVEHEEDDLRDAIDAGVDMRSLSFHSVTEMMTLGGSCGVMLFGYTGARTVSHVALVIGLSLAPTAPVTMRVVRPRVDGPNGICAPLSRSLHTATAVNGHKLFVFGGWHKEDDASDPGDQATSDGRFLGDGWILDTVRMVWQPCAFNDADNSGRRPGPRCGHTSVVIAGRVYIYGGETLHGATDQLHVYDWITHTWSFEEHLHVVNGGGSRPAARSGHSAAKVGSRMIIHGGFSAERGGPLADTFIFDVTSLRWTEVGTVDGVSRDLCSRHHADSDDFAMSEDRDGNGDADGDAIEETISDVRDHNGSDGGGGESDPERGSTDEQSWSDASDDDDIEAQTYFPEARTGHASCVVGLRVYVHGGYAWDGSPSGDLAALDASIVRTPELQLVGANLDPYEIEMTSPVPRGVRAAFQWFVSERGAPFVALKTVRDVNRFSPTVDDIGSVVGVSCCLMMGGTRIGPSAFLQSAEVRPDVMMLATAKMLLIRQEADFTNLTLLPHVGSGVSEETQGYVRDD